MERGRWNVSKRKKVRPGTRAGGVGDDDDDDDDVRGIAQLRCCVFPLGFFRSRLGGGGGRLGSGMGIFISKLFASLFGDREARILVLGLDNAGKTTILCIRVLALLAFTCLCGSGGFVCLFVCLFVWLVGFWLSQ